MINIVSKSELKKESIDKFLSLATELVEKSRKESGCISYNLYKDINNNNIYTFIEEWKDKNAIEMHNNSEHFTRIVPQLKDLRDNSELNLYIKIK